MISGHFSQVISDHIAHPREGCILEALTLIILVRVASCEALTSLILVRVASCEALASLILVRVASCEALTSLILVRVASCERSREAWEAKDIEKKKHVFFIAV